MTYPNALDSDASIIRIDDNITELGGEAINQLRAAVFGIENELGLGLRGSMDSFADRINVALNANGTIKQSALAAVGLVTLPIDNSQVGANAGIAESKLSLDYSTSDLHTLILAHKSLLDSVNAFLQTTSTDFLSHLAGTVNLSDGSTSARHVASHIDLNQVPSDSRDTNYTWGGLLDKDGNARSAAHVASALLQINTELVDHENATDDAHEATAINVDTSEFQEIPTTANTLQKLADYLDDSEVLNLGQHRAVQHAAGIPRIARSASLTAGDGYGAAIVPVTTVYTYLAHPPANAPVDSNTSGDDIIEFVSDNTDYVFDSQFGRVQPGDVVRINYANGLETSFVIREVRFVADTEWFVRINGTNLCESTDGYAQARIDRAVYDTNTYGVLALAAANSIPSNLYPSLMGSLIAGNPRGACALGLEFDGNKINSDHYKLYLQLYPTGNPADIVIDLPAIDVTGNAGVTPGTYTLSKIVQETNNAFRRVAYNYRFIAFEHEGNFGIMLADAIDNASFSIVNNVTGTYTNNVIGDESDGFDGLGLGSAKAGLASPAYQATFADSTAAATPTYIIAPAKYRNFIVNGQRRDTFAPTVLANDDGYWDATINAKVSTGSSVEVTYRVDLDLSTAGLWPGKTLVVQPVVDYDDANYVTNDYGRFIIKSVNYVGSCGEDSAYTTITVISGVHATAVPISFTSGVNFPVKIYFSGDSIGFNDSNSISAASAGDDYHRYHEVYITDAGRTFAHERARMIVQTESSTLLGTARWHVTNVSPKLRGYRDSISSQNRYLRFYVLSYDSTSGAYDGYVGQRDPSTATISKYGPVTEGRKNVPSRFYDESYNDYIDIEFTELSAGPGTTILSTALPRYVDIEIFPSLRQQDELLLLGSCEVNWDPQSGQNVVQHVKSLRQFGSIDEMDFTRSAMDFISAGDRALHDNGIIRGYEFSSVVETDTGELLFTGGEALVNGRIVNSNAMSVTIPAISEGGAPATVTWAVCVNMDGFLEPILITSTADQFFAGSADYYVPSVTFAELVTNRRDLTPIALVDAAIASITVTNDDVTDVRKFISRQDSAHPLVLSGEGFEGNFTSFESMCAWLKNRGVTGSKAKVRLRGTFTVSETVDLSELGVALEFEGDDALVNVTASKGFLIDGNVTFKNINFTYNPSGISYTANDYVNRTNGCIFADDADTLRSNITIESCKFSCTMAGTQRPPFVMMEMAAGDMLDNVRIVNNLFEDSTTSEQAAIAIIGAVSGASTDASLLANSDISNNFCNSRQGIYVTSLASTAGVGNSMVKTFAAPGLRTAGVTVRNNTCGTIGFVTSGRPNAAGADGYYLESLLHLDGNRALYIGIADATGRGSVEYTRTSLVVSFGTGHHKITNNHAAWIHDVVRDEAANNISASTVITGNSLSAFSSAYLSTRYIATMNAGIYVNGLSTDKGAVLISGNTTNKRLIGSDVYSYSYGVHVSRSATIVNNILRGFATTPTSGGPAGIALDPATSSGDSYLIANNSLYRGSDDLTSAGAYVICLNVNTSAEVMVVDNYFDSMYIDSANTYTNSIRLVFGSESPLWFIKGNKNYLRTAYVRGHNGSAMLSTSSQAAGVAGRVSLFGKEASGGAAPNASDSQHAINAIYDDSEAIEVLYIDTGSAIYVTWSIPLSEVLPMGAVVKSVSVDVNIGNSASTATAVLYLADRIRNDSDTIAAMGVTAEELSLGTGTSNIDNGYYRVTPSLAPFVKLDITLDDSGTNSVTVSQMTITYLEA